MLSFRLSEGAELIYRIGHFFPEGTQNISSPAPQVVKFSLQFADIGALFNQLEFSNLSTQSLKL
jgi:hypothetical protein